MTQENVAAYWSGKWRGDVPLSDANFEACFHLARILEYVECPQYLRKYLFSFQKPLKYAGEGHEICLLNPLDAHHHLRSDDLSIPFREGVILDKPIKAGRGMLCDVGLEKELELEDKIHIPASTRVTVEIANLGAGISSPSRYAFSIYGSTCTLISSEEKEGQFFLYEMDTASKGMKR
ncbi:unnamed protein product [Cylicostephanus goldi]|uniref:Uncharacterized protein n=1 Tax=Cylicostephanus goldi TaxID=71465 RepID=A0A3P6SSZ3_CYLGO|nr:unnamed protein product [Cylicostephanus goldi]